MEESTDDSYKSAEDPAYQIDPNDLREVEEEVMTEKESFKQRGHYATKKILQNLLFLV